MNNDSVLDCATEALGIAGSSFFRVWKRRVKSLRDREVARMFESVSSWENEGGAMENPE